MEERLSRIRSLIGEIEDRETELNGLMAGAAVKQRKEQECSICHGSDHTARTCPHKHQKNGTPEVSIAK